MMSEKRFKLIKIDDYVFQIHDTDNDLYLVAEQICNLLNEQEQKIQQLEKENEKLKKWLLLYNEDEVDKYLRTHPMPTTTTITTKRKVIPLDMRHKW